MLIALKKDAVSAPIGEGITRADGVALDFPRINLDAQTVEGVSLRTLLRATFDHFDLPPRDERGRFMPRHLR